MSGVPVIGASSPLERRAAWKDDAMAMPIIALGIFFLAGALLGVVSRWLLVCICEVGLLVATLIVALLLHKSVSVALGLLCVGFVLLQVAYVFSGFLLQLCRQYVHSRRGKPVDRFN